jgi:hypothetical protein
MNFLTDARYEMCQMIRDDKKPNSKKSHVDKQFGINVPSANT